MNLMLMRGNAGSRALRARFPGAAMAADFSKGLYYADGAKSLGQLISDARNTEIVLPDANGNLVTIPAGQPARTSKGLGGFGAATNLALNSGFTLGTDGGVPTSWIERGSVTGRRVAGGSTSTQVHSPDVMRVVAAAGGLIAASDDVRQFIVGLTASQSYRITFKAKLDTGSVENRLTYVFSGSSGSVTLTSDYQSFAFSATASGSAHSLFFGSVSGATGELRALVTDLQVELGPVVTPYIPTTTATVARAACEPNVTQGAGSIPFAGYTPGPQTGKVTASVPVSAIKRILKRWVMNTTDYVELYYSSAGAITLESVTGGISRGLVSVGGKDDGLEHSITYLLSPAGHLKLAVDLDVPTTTTGLNMPASFNAIELGHGATAGQMNDFISAFAVVSGDRFDEWRAAA